MEIKKQNKSTKSFLRKAAENKEQDQPYKKNNIKKLIQNFAIASSTALMLFLSPMQVSNYLPAPKSNSILFYNQHITKIDFYKHALKSRNWSGYIATAKSQFLKSEVITGVSAQWDIPHINANSINTENPKIYKLLWLIPLFSVPTNEVTWIGIGGLISNNDLIQTGTESYYSQQRHKISYRAWYELLPGFPHYINSKIFPVKPGDEISAKIKLLNTPNTWDNIWKIELKNLTENKTFKTTVDYSSSMSSAEWVVERLSADLIYSYFKSNLEQFGKIKFKDAAAQIKKHNTLVYRPVEMINKNNQIIAKPTKINDGLNFSIEN